MVRIYGYTNKKKQEVLDMKCKKLGVLLAMVLVGVSASPTWTVSAAESQDLPQQVLDISNGSDEIYGPGAPIEHVENPDARFVNIQIGQM